MIAGGAGIATRLTGRPMRPCLGRIAFSSPRRRPAPPATRKMPYGTPPFHGRNPRRRGLPPAVHGLRPAVNRAARGLQAPRRDPHLRNRSRPRPRPPRPDADELAAQLDHFLVAIVPGDQQAWFLKLTGRADAVERHRDEFLQLLASFDPSGDRPAWTLPEGWEERPSTEMRLATLVVPDPGGPLELAVSSLPLDRHLGQLCLREHHALAPPAGPAPA